MGIIKFNGVDYKNKTLTKLSAIDFPCVEPFIYYFFIDNIIPFWLS